MNKTAREAILKLVSQARIAEECQRSTPAVNQWFLGKRPVPAEHCVTIERLLNGAVKVEEMRPDLFWHRTKSGEIFWRKG